MIQLLSNALSASIAPASMPLTRKQIQRGVHRSVAELEAGIMAFIDAHNDNPQPYKWVKSADEIRASVKRFCLKTINRTAVPGD